jgi:hypothetical protein
MRFRVDRGVDPFFLERREAESGRDRFRDAGRFRSRGLARPDLINRDCYCYGYCYDDDCHCCRSPRLLRHVNAAWRILRRFRYSTVMARRRSNLGVFVSAFAGLLVFIHGETQPRLIERVLRKSARQSTGNLYESKPITWPKHDGRNASAFERKSQTTHATRMCARARARVYLYQRNAERMITRGALRCNSRAVIALASILLTRSTLPRATQLR